MDFVNASLPSNTPLARWLVFTALAMSALPSLEAAAPLRVMSFNIRYGAANDGDNHWRHRRDFVAETIRRFDPDLLGTQETLDFQKQFLQEQLPGYTAIGVGRDDGSDRGEMTAIFFRTGRFKLLDQGHFWLSTTPDVPGSKSWDTSLTRMASWVKLRDRRQPTAPPLLMINTHFDHRGAEARRESAKLIRRQAAKIGAGCDVILTGDFNAAVNSPPYQALFGDPENNAAGPPFRDSYLATETAPESSGEATFNGFKGLVTQGARIDWIAVSDRWSVKRADILRPIRNGRNPSDHEPVIATLTRTHQKTSP